MKLPRDIGGHALAKALGRYGYQVTRQTGRHIRLTTHQGGEHHVTIPSHAILDEVAQHLTRHRSELIHELWG